MAEKRGRPFTGSSYWNLSIPKLEAKRRDFIAKNTEESLARAQLIANVKRVKANKKICNINADRAAQDTGVPKPRVKTRAPTGRPRGRPRKQ
jgi:hypothetical protein